MKNDFEIRGHVTAIFLRRKNKPALEAIIDTADLAAVGAVPGTWHSIWNNRSKTFYAVSKSVGGKLWMHRCVLNAPENLEVDHRDHYGLNNRRSNLRCATRSENGLNRRGPAADNRSSGIRGVNAVSYAPGKWQARVKVAGVSHYLGVFGDKRIAENAVRSKLSELGVPIHG